MAEPAHVQTQLQHGILILTLTAEEISGPEVCQPLQEEMVAAVEQANVKSVVISFEKVKFVGSNGVTCFLALRRMAHLDRIIFFDVPERIQELFRLCQLVSKDPSRPALFRIAANLEEAVAQIPLDE